MKRSEINRIIRFAEHFFAEMKWALPPWAYWTPKEWERFSGDLSEIRAAGLGWDITDFGSGNFYTRGLLLFTLRNGSDRQREKTYAEKIMVVEENQETPMHYHYRKTEDIINRGGGVLNIELYNAENTNELAQTPVTVSVDGIKKTVDAGGVVSLEPGMSVCLTPGVFHRFQGEKEKGTVLVGEVSSVNDDEADNHFYEPLGRFPEIDEDEAPLRLLTSDY